MTTARKTLLLISVACNMLLIGLIASHFLQIAINPCHQSPREMIEEVAAQYNPETSQMVLDLTQTAYEANQVHKNIIRERRTDIFNILSAEPFDPVAYQHAIHQLNVARVNMKQRYADATMEIAQHLSQKERIIYAQMLEKMKRCRLSRKNHK